MLHYYRCSKSKKDLEQRGELLIAKQIRTEYFEEKATLTIIK